MRKLGDLLDGLADAETLQPYRELPISGVFDDSRRVTPGGLFVALRGGSADGRRFIDDALARGATALVGEQIGTAAGGGARPACGFEVADGRAVLAALAARWHAGESPTSFGLKLLGVTGTNGKSTTTHMVRSILRAAGQRCGMLGTVQYDLGSRSVAADMTTPGPLQLCALLCECAGAGASAAVMEVSSHALEQRRTDGLRFDAAAFTNLTQDHLDYHQTMEAYADAKARLFARLSHEAVAVVNADDPAHTRMLRDCRARVMTFSVDGKAEISATIKRSSIVGTLYRVRLEGRDLVLENALVGKHNVYNALTAIGLCRAIGVPLEAIEAGLAGVRTIPGRLQRVPCVGEVDVFVDYAHTDDALRSVCGVLRGLTRRRLLVLFGCGGDRDRGKRPKMARAAGEFADAVVVTSDNPRSEDPQAIIDEILTGFDDDVRRKVAVEPDRRRAIHATLASAHKGDVVLIAGKGHEDYQIVGKQRLHFDDVEVAIQAAAELHSERIGAA